MLSLPILLSVSLTIQAAAFPSPSINTADYGPSSIIRRDVCVIGGGSSGTYAAIGLRDKGKSVAVIEKQGVLGGHTNTYTDPNNGTKVDYGVVVFGNTSIVTSYFGRFDVPLTSGTGSFSTNATIYNVDFRTGKIVPGYVAENPTAAFTAYAAQLAKYPYLSEPGWNLPDPVPAELLMPFGDFVSKYELGAAVQTINQYAQGFGDILTIPTLYLLKYFNRPVLVGAQTAFLTTARRDNSEIYEKARAELGKDVFLNSTVLATSRNANGVRIVVKTPQGVKLILAKKLLISIPPKLSNFKGFDLSTTEQGLFSQFRNGGYYTGLLRNTGIPDNILVNNIGADTPYNLPAVPGSYAFSPTLVPGLKDLKVGTPTAISDAEVKALVVAEIDRLKTAGTITTATTPEFVAYNSHTPYELRVSADAIQAGFYKNLNALQGHKNTWWTGAAFDKHASGELWAFTARLLPDIAA